MFERQTRGTKEKYKNMMIHISSKDPDVHDSGLIHIIKYDGNGNMEKFEKHFKDEGMRKHDVRSTFSMGLTLNGEWNTSESHKDGVSAYAVLDKWFRPIRRVTVKPNGKLAVIEHNYDMFTGELLSNSHGTTYQYIRHQLRNEDCDNVFTVVARNDKDEVTRISRFITMKDQNGEEYDVKTGSVSISLAKIRKHKKNVKEITGRALVYMTMCDATDDDVRQTIDPVVEFLELSEFEHTEGVLTRVKTRRKGEDGCHWLDLMTLEQTNPNCWLEGIKHRWDRSGNLLAVETVKAIYMHT